MGVSALKLGGGRGGGGGGGGGHGPPGPPGSDVYDSPDPARCAEPGEQEHYVSRCPPSQESSLIVEYMHVL